MSDLDDIIKGETEQTEAVETPAETTEVAEQVETKAEEVEQVETKGEESETPAENNKSKEVDVGALQAEVESLRKESGGLKSAAAAERKKRQDAENAEPEKNFFDDPDKAIADIKTEFDEKLVDNQIRMSEKFARKNHEDFSNKMEVFGKLAAEDPTLVAKMRANEDPAEFAYNEADKHQKLSEFGDMASYADKIRAEEAAKFESKLDSLVEAKLKERQDLPGTLSNVRSAGTSDKPPGQQSLGDVLGR